MIILDSFFTSSMMPSVPQNIIMGIVVIGARKPRAITAKVKSINIKAMFIVCPSKDSIACISQ